MAEPLTAGLPTDLDLSGGFIVRITAVDPTTGATVSGVTVSNGVITGRDLLGLLGGDFTPQVFDILLPIAVGQEAA